VAVDRAKPANLPTYTQLPPLTLLRLPRQADEALKHPWLMLSDAALQRRDLHKSHAAMKRWNRKRKLKKVFHTVVAANRMHTLLGGLKKAAAIEVEAQRAQAAIELAAEAASGELEAPPSVADL
jgi:hypothetical protein